MAFFAVFLPAGAFADFFAVAAVFFAAIVTTPLMVGAGNCCRLSGTQNEAGFQDSLR